MDLLGPFSKSTSENKWIIIVANCLTRYAAAKVLPKETAADAAKFFVECIFLQHSALKALITDRGTGFMTELTQAILY